MALGGTILGSYSGSTTYKPYLRWSVEQDIDANTSVMSVTFGMYKAKTSTLSYNITPRAITVLVNGTTYTRSVGFDFRDKDVGTYNDMFTIEGIEIVHDEDGKAPTTTMSARHSTNISLAVGTVSGTANITAISRATLPAVGSSVLYVGSTISVSTPRTSDAYTHVLKYSVGERSGTIASGVATSTLWNIPATLAEEFPKSVTGAGTLTCETYNGNDLVGIRSIPITLSVPNTSAFAPSVDLSKIVLADANGHLSHFGAYVQNKSKLTAQWGNAAAQGVYGSTITKRAMTVNGVEYVGQAVTSELLSVPGSITVTLAATDSRGRVGTATATITVLEHSNPQISKFSVYRGNADGAEDTDGSYICISTKYAISSLDSQNTPRIRVSYKLTTAQTYSAILEEAAELGNNELTFAVTNTPISGDYRYDVQFELWDYFTAQTPTTRYGMVEIEEVILDFRSTGKGLAIGKVAETDGLELAWKTTVPEPTAATDATNKGYVDTAIADKFLTVSAAPVYVSNTNYTLTAQDNGKIISFSYAIRSENIEVTLQQSESANMPVGAEIAIVRSWGANVTIKVNGIRVALPGYLTTGVGGLTPTTEVSLTISKPFDTIVLKKIEQGSIDVWVVQGDVEYANIKNATLTVTAAQSIPINLKPGEIMQVAYLTSSQAAANITLKVNGAAPDGGYYTPSQENNNYTGGIITYSGSTALASAQFSMQIVNDRLLVWGTGIRGNGSGFGTFNAFWKTTAPTSFSISAAGTVVYKKIQ